MGNLFSDIIVVGAGPAGLSFAKKFKDSQLKITVIEKSPLSIIENPPFDAREIALTHLSKDFLEKNGIWDRVPPKEIYRLKDAKVVNGTSPYQLHFQQPTKARGKTIDRLGYLIPNVQIRKAAYDSIKDIENIQLITDTTVQNVHIDEDRISAELDNGDNITGRLLVCADSRFSTIRKKVGIPTDIHDFGRTVLCFRMEHTISNDHTAFECFHYGRTLAILPLEENISNMVITIDSNKVDELLNMSNEELENDIFRETEGRLGKLKLISSKHTYPLIGTHARRFFDQRTALIGDAAVGMHPVTAHGFNLGLQSVDILASLILTAEKNNKDIGSETLLERYNFKHMLNTRPIYHGTNFLVKLFTNETPPAKFLRSSLLKVSNHLSPIKKLISKQLTG